MITIIDYGVGNLRSVEKAFQFIGCRTEVTSDPQRVRNADAVVLPGVGAYADAMENLKAAGMAEVVREAIGQDKPFLGICLGMQLLFDYSEEGGSRTAGLGIFPGSIRQLPPDRGVKIPHMGWNSLQTREGHGLFQGLPQSAYVYFVHSFYLTSEDRELVTARTRYGIEFDVAVGRGRVFATQFHPEKSGSIGLTMLKNFAAIAGNAV